MTKELKLLLKQCRKENKKAQLKIYDLYCGAMFTIASRYVDAEEAKDIMQESFLNAFTKIEKYNDAVSFGAWLKRIVINQCIDHLRKQKLEFVPLENQELEIENDSDWYFKNTITKEQIIKAIEQIPQKHQIVIKLYLLEGYDHSEISEILKIPIKTSRTHLRRAKLGLQKLLKDVYHEARY
ncbi:RNA polymerase sigma-70 factor [Tenacibaculum holothuriorum]|uniref:RNA polymerase sigma-70 factor n=1 Tax=Tenacibaculum holothuriorum TaxID=1635173 RepID=A0A1Y2PGR6_9FLAO|nr:RNA polymerase sigma factor [Tenacibaculum holothuriorum]OSY88987.1 RNA polymerase sigma-70 factor [Tenacibaculum holothuriorum]